MLRLLILLTGVTFFNCTPFKPTAGIGSAEANCADLKLLEASYENWTSGIRGGGKGTEYFFKVIVLTADKITFDSAWMKNNGYPLFITKELTAVSSGGITFAKNDTITLRISDIAGNTIKKNIAPPVIYNGSALVRYSKGSKTKYLIIKEITERLSPKRQ